MGLDPKLLYSLPDTLVDMYGLVEIDILTDMARRISTYDYFIPAALHQNQKLQELGVTQDLIIKRLSSMTGQTQDELVALLTEASTEAIADDVEYYTRAEVYEPSKVNTEALHAQLNSGLLQTEQSFFNITKTTASTATKQFERALDRVWTQINVGGIDYTTAIKNAIVDLGKSGIGSIEYKSGRIDNIEVAVRRAVVTGANQTAMRTQETLADELGVDLVEVTAHGGARPAHAKWQGKVFGRKGKVTIDGVTYEDLKTATGYGRADGLGGVNCRHSFHPYVHGTSREYSDMDLKELDKKKIKYNGEEYSEYEASQIQRSIEREIRKNKRTVQALEAGGQDASAERKALRDAQKTYTDFTAQTGIRKQSARTQVPIVENNAKAEEEKRSRNNAKIVKSAEYAVDNKKLQGRQYANKFKSMTDDAKERREFLKNTKEMLRHRSGQNGEDIYLYNTRTKRWYKSTTGQTASTPEYTKEIKDGIARAKSGELISFHNHPASMPPSDKDMNAAYYNKYKRAYALCHNGKIFEYTAPKEPINEKIYNLRLAKYKEMGYNEYDAQLNALKYLSEIYGFTFREVK